VIFYPTGGGTGLIGMWKAFAELEAIGLIGPERPRMVAVQAEGCAPMVRAWERGEEHAERWEDAHTVAAGIRVPKAVGDFLILRAVRESGGLPSRYRTRLSRGGGGSGARRRAAALPGRRGDAGGVPAGDRAGGDRADEPGGAVQLRHWAQISDAGPLRSLSKAGPPRSTMRRCSRRSSDLA
jgi:hypothetical protein